MMKNREHVLGMACMLLIGVIGFLAVRVSAETPEAYSVHIGKLPGETPDSDILVTTNLYTLSLDRDTKLARWCGFVVTAASQHGSNQLNRNWQNRLPESTLEHQDYIGSGYHMGHLAPLASFRADPDAAELNWLGNVAPQTPALNAGPWLKMEDFVRSLAREHGRCFVIVGPLYEADMKPLARAEEPHRVPSHFWARARVPAVLTNHWIMPQSCERTDPLEMYSVAAADLCRRSGLRLCSDKPCEACDGTGRKIESTDRDRTSDRDDNAQRPKDSHLDAGAHCTAASRRVSSGERWRDCTRCSNGRDGDSALRMPMACQCDDPVSCALGECGCDCSCLPDCEARRSERPTPDAHDASTRGANMIRQTVSGGDDLDKLLATLPFKMRMDIMPKGLRAGATVVQKAAREKVTGPGYPGDKPGLPPLRDAIIVRVKRYDNATVAIVGPTYLGAGNHAHLVEFGHRLVKKIKTLEGVEKVQIGFVPAYPFMRPSADETKDAQATAIETTVANEVAKFQREVMS